MVRIVLLVMCSVAGASADVPCEIHEIADLYRQGEMTWQKQVGRPAGQAVADLAASHSRFIDYANISANYNDEIFGGDELARERSASLGVGLSLRGPTAADRQVARKMAGLAKAELAGSKEEFLLTVLQRYIAWGSAQKHRVHAEALAREEEQYYQALLVVLRAGDSDEFALSDLNAERSELQVAAARAAALEEAESFRLTSLLGAKCELHEWSGELPHAGSDIRSTRAMQLAAAADVSAAQADQMARSNPWTLSLAVTMRQPAGQSAIYGPMAQLTVPFGNPQRGQIGRTRSAAKRFAAEAKFAQTQESRLAAELQELRLMKTAECTKLKEEILSPSAQRQEKFSKALQARSVTIPRFLMVRRQHRHVVHEVKQCEVEEWALATELAGRVLIAGRVSEVAK